MSAGPSGSKSGSSASRSDRRTSSGIGNRSAGGKAASGGRSSTGPPTRTGAQVRGLPVSGRVTSGYGTRKDPVTHAPKEFHAGIDIRARIGTPVRATSGGKVVRAGWQDPKDHKKGYGERVTVNSGHGNTETYGHLSKISVKVGQTVSRGQVLGKSGNTGKSTAPHVHYGEQHNGNPHRPTFNPGSYKPRKPKSDTRRH